MSSPGREAPGPAAVLRAVPADYETAWQAQYNDHPGSTVADPDSAAR
jgi:hypothetical protein